MLTVVTATYNRAYTLPRLFDSLLQQTRMNFEWVVVDDGSTDETESLLKDFQAQATFPMKVIKQENAGKHVAINSGVQSSSGAWVYFVDSDDALTADAVEVFTAAATSDRDKTTVGYCYRRQAFSGKIVGRPTDGSTAELRVMTPTAAGNFYEGDLAYIFKRAALIKHPFPVFVGEKFVPELLIWNRISDEGIINFFGNKILYLCEYLEDGYTANFSSMLRRNPLGFGLYYKHQIFREKSAVRKIKCLIRYVQCLIFSMTKERFS
ncbi:glycosyltransferase family 2 protein [Pseudomonas helleri]|uniref:glycosyltransferase family A protein n=1 Tax=Pseudomonas helleri TaxID=1608996 RepID=UPI0028E24584|nr:glycosyltransferase family 2 protein [Pseudomonas helleri]